MIVVMPYIPFQVLACKVLVFRINIDVSPIRLWNKKNTGGN